MRLKPLFNQRDIDKMFEKHQQNAEKRFFDVLVQGGEYAVKEARENGQYNDITGNLRSSVGYMILKDGHELLSDFEQSKKGSDRVSGVQEGKAFALQVAKNYSKGYILIVVAGMEYAAYVENMETKDVLTGAVYATDSYLEGLVNLITKE